MQNLLKVIPLILILGTAPLAHGNPSIAQAIMLTAIALLFGYNLYLESLKQPDYVKIFTERLDKKDIDIDKKLQILIKEIEETKANQGKLNIAKNTENKIKNFKW